MSKNNKEDAPLDGFVNYYAYKVEERRFDLEHPIHSVDVDQKKAKRLVMKDTEVVRTDKTAVNYVQYKHYNKREFYVSRQQYCDIEFMNKIPEIVCDILFYLSGYVHYRTDSMSEEAYRNILMGQYN